MSEIIFLVFTNGEKAVMLVGFQDLPEKYHGYPFIKITPSFSQVVLTELIEANKYSRELIREEILELIEFYGRTERACMEFPYWDTMFIYAMKPENVKRENMAEYEDIEQLVDSYLSLRGPEFII